LPATLIVAALAGIATPVMTVSSAPPPASPPTCQPDLPQRAAAPNKAAPHPLGEEPAASRMHAVLREVAGCIVVDVAAYRQGAPAWEYRLAGPADVRPKTIVILPAPRRGGDTEGR
jgi:hypothetical protein